MSLNFRKTFAIMAVSAILVGSLAVLALAAQAPKLTLKLTAEKEVRSVKNGKEVIEMKPADTVNAGDTVLYTITYTNVGDSDAVDAEIADPVPGNMAYVPGSAKGAGADVAFSIDGGRTFQKLPKRLVTGKDGRSIEKDASPAEYTNIRWTLKKVAPKQSGSVSFKAKFK